MKIWVGFVSLRVLSTINDYESKTPEDRTLVVKARALLLGGLRVLVRVVASLHERCARRRGYARAACCVVFLCLYADGEHTRCTRPITEIYEDERGGVRRSNV